MVLYCIVLYCIVLYCIVLYCIVLYCIVLYCIVLYCIVLYCIVLYCIVLYCIVLYCIVLCYVVQHKTHFSGMQQWLGCIPRKCSRSAPVHMSFLRGTGVTEIKKIIKKKLKPFSLRASFNLDLGREAGEEVMSAQAAVSLLNPLVRSLTTQCSVAGAVAASWQLGS